MEVIGGNVEDEVMGLSINKHEAFILAMILDHGLVWRDLEAASIMLAIETVHSALFKFGCGPDRYYPLNAKIASQTDNEKGQISHKDRAIHFSHWEKHANPPRLSE